MIIPKNTLVDIHRTLLTPGDRSPHIPEDTRKTNFEMSVKGLLLADSRIGDTVEIVTPIGRRHRGTLKASLPPYTHGFGEPIPELLSIGSELRSILRAIGEAGE